jgi:hypothetical protein
MINEDPGKNKYYSIYKILSIQNKKRQKQVLEGKFALTYSIMDIKIEIAICFSYLEVQ